MRLERRDTARLMAALGFRAVRPEDGQPRWAWRGLTRAIETRPAHDNAFAALADLGVRLG